MSILDVLKQRLAGTVSGLASTVGKEGVGNKLADYQSDYDRRVGEYDALDSDYARSVRNQDYSHQAYNREGGLWNQLEQQRSDGSVYGGDRFYQAGEIYNYDPVSGGYKGSISGQAINQPGEYQRPELAPNPGPYDKYMADDPYYQILQDPHNINNPNYVPKPPPPSNPIANIIRSPYERDDIRGNGDGGTGTGGPGGNDSGAGPGPGGVGR